MNFASDNAWGALPQVMDALAAANMGAAKPYGDDEITQGLTARFAALFERDVAVFPVTTGTAANALALATLTPPHGAILCHAESHIAEHECGAPEFYAHSAKLIGLAGNNGKLTLETITRAIDAIHAVSSIPTSLSACRCPSPLSWARSMTWRNSPPSRRPAMPAG